MTNLRIETHLQMLNEEEAAKYLRLSPRTLQKRRGDGFGPPFIKLGGRVVYRIADLDAWVTSCRRTSTSEAA
jgi:predicted DNA-binding transcriptional regulator AlpA